MLNATAICVHTYMANAHSYTYTYIAMYVCTYCNYKMFKVNIVDLFKSQFSLLHSFVL